MYSMQHPSKIPMCQLRRLALARHVADYRHISELKDVIRIGVSSAPGNTYAPDGKLKLSRSQPITQPSSRLSALSEFIGVFK